MGNLTYLTALVPSGENVPYELAKRLNAKQLKPVRKAFYTEGMINNILYGKTKDENVKAELILWLRESHTAEELKAKIQAWQNRGSMMVSELL